MPRAVFAGAVVLFLSASLAFAGPPKGPWEGYGVGTWVHTKTSATTQIPGVQVPAQVSEQRQTLVKVTDAEWVVKTEIKAGDAWTDAGEFPWPRKAPVAPGQVPEMKTEDLGSENVTVEGKEHSCKKTRTTVPTPGSDSPSVTTAWVSEEHGLLKSRTEGAGNETVVEVTSLSKKAKLGDKEVVCRETKTTSKGPGMEMTSVSLTSDTVPGLLVRSEATTSASGVKSETVSEVVGFEVK